MSPAEIAALAAAANFQFCVGRFDNALSEMEAASLRAPLYDPALEPTYTATDLIYSSMLEAWAVLLEASDGFAVLLPPVVPSADALGELLDIVDVMLDALSSEAQRLARACGRLGMRRDAALNNALDEASKDRFAGFRHVDRSHAALDAVQAAATEGATALSEALVSAAQIADALDHCYPEWARENHS